MWPWASLLAPHPCPFCLSLSLIHTYTPHWLCLLTLVLEVIFFPGLFFFFWLSPCLLDLVVQGLFTSWSDLGYLPLSHDAARGSTRWAAGVSLGALSALDAVKPMSMPHKTQPKCVPQLLLNHISKCTHGHSNATSYEGKGDRWWTWHRKRQLS